MTRKFTHAPLWANIIYVVLERTETVWDRLGERLFAWRHPLIDKCCQCTECLIRRGELKGRCPAHRSFNPCELREGHGGPHISGGLLWED